MQGPDSFRKTLRSALPWQQSGFAIAALAVALPAVLGFDWLASFTQSIHIDSIARIGGFVGASAFLIGTLIASRSRQAAKFSSWLSVSCTFWAGEWLLRLSEFFSDSPSRGWIAARAILGGAGGATLAMGMLALLPPANFRALRNRWRTSRAAFGGQLAVFALITAGGALSDKKFSDWLADPLQVSNWILPLLWIVFAAPYVHMFFCLRSTATTMVRRDSISDILLS